MAFLPVEGAEPFQGYQLVKRLGMGGYGEVWKVTAPGGLNKAIKIVFGHLNEDRAEQEFKALSRIKEVRHPFLLSLERIEIIEGQLFIVTELADKSLMDRFRECQESGLRGIPRDELLGYIRDAADALDYMSENYGLQHLDIKPQNLLLVGGRIKIGDFGLVKDLQGTSVTATGGVTPVYASPEAFDARVSRFSDQYSLAIVYQEMLTGVRPFPGTTALQLAAQHTSSPPLVEPLPHHDRPVISRALAKIPVHRFGSCREMVENLYQAVRQAGSAALVTPSLQVPSAPAAAPDSWAKETPLDQAENDRLLALATEVSLRPRQVPSAVPDEVSRSTPKESIEAYEELQVRPTLFLGIGGLAGKTLRFLKQKLLRKLPSLEQAPIFRLLLVDTDRAGIQAALNGDVGENLTPEETMLASLRRPDDYREKSKDFLRWLDRRWLYGVPRSLQTEGIRPLGRLALVDNAMQIGLRLQEVLSRATNPEAINATAKNAGLRLRSEVPRVFIIASIGGGTGSGMVLDLAYAIRQALTNLYQSATGICGILLFATGSKNSERHLARVNALATLRELNHYSRLDNPYWGDPVYGLARFGPDVAPFQDCYVAHLGDQLGGSQWDSAAEAVADYLYLDSLTSVGRFLDQYRQNTHTGPHAADTDMAVRTFGLFRIGFPKRQLIRLLTHRWCAELTDKWRGAQKDNAQNPWDRGPDAPDWIKELDPDHLQKSVYEQARSVWGEDPETHFRKLLDDSAEANTGAMTDVFFTKARELLGAGGEKEAGANPEPTAIENELKVRSQRIADGLIEKASESLLALIEDPDGRLKAADRAARWLLQQLRSAENSLRSQHDQNLGQRQSLLKRLTEKDAAKRGSGRWLGMRRQADPRAELAQSLVSYCSIRLGEIAIEHALEIIGAVARPIGEFLQELDLARKKLEFLSQDFQKSFVNLAARGSRPAAHVLELLPGKSANIHDAAMIVFGDLNPKFLPGLDHEVQKELLVPRGGLWRLLSGSEELGKSLRSDLEDCVLQSVRKALRELDAAQLFIHSYPEREQAEQALRDQVHKGEPRLKGAKEWTQLVLTMPDSDPGKELREFVVNALPDLPTTVFFGEEDVILCHDAAHLPLTEVAAEIVGSDERCHDTSKQVMTRIDVPWSDFEVTLPGRI
jgi:serine/threonine protein kinase